MPIRKIEKRVLAPPANVKERTGEYTSTYSRPQPYQAIQLPKLAPSLFPQGAIPSISSRELGYFFDAAASLYQEVSSQSSPPNPASHLAGGLMCSPPYDTTAGYSAPPEYGSDFRQVSLDISAILVMRVFRQTRIDIYPIAERFHFGTADRQPLYSLTAQPSIRSGTEFNELVIKRRDPINGVWYHTCTSDIEPSLQLARPGNWTVAKLVLESMPVWKKIAAGVVLSQAPLLGKGNSLRLSWGDRLSLGSLGDAYNLWWDNGTEGGMLEAFYIIEGWKGFDSHPQGVIRVKPVATDLNGRYLDPRHNNPDLAVIYFHPDGKSPPQFVCMNPQAHIKLDIIMAGLMTVLVVETRKTSVVKELGALPAYGSNAQWSSELLQEGEDLGDAWVT